MSFVSLVKWFRWLWLDPLPAYDYCLFEMIAIKSLYIRNTSILFFAKWCQNAIQASVQNCSFIAALTQIRAVTHTQIQIHKCRQKASIEFLYKFSSSLIFFFWFFETIPMFLRAHESTLGTHIHTHLYTCICIFYVSVCLFFASPSCASSALAGNAQKCFCAHQIQLYYFKSACNIFNLIFNLNGKL